MCHLKGEIMELDIIEFYNNKVHLIISYDEQSYRIELEAREFFDKLASAFYSAQAVKPEREDETTSRS
jgi:hypothetical protein